MFNLSVCPTCNEGLVSIGLVKLPVKEFSCSSCLYEFASDKEAIQVEEKREPIAVLCMGHGLSLHIYAIQEGIEDELLVGYNSDEPEWVTTEYEEVFAGSGDQMCFSFKGQRFLMDEFIRVGVGPFSNTM